ncbi:MAG TPA: metalloregulator ArsR/SmtB family transcription factor [Pseudonocardiaceae bacterium]|nr:metalloregulator ArsR/SmtB family transcription factor [Pseudonocardiaceae bacterium]
MKNVGADPGPVPSGTVSAHADGRTRQAVTQLLLERGPVTAALIADALGLSPAAVRRHLDALVAEGAVGTRDAPRRGQRGRGRPAKLFLLTEAGRARFGHAYDDLAVSALRFLADRGGEQAIRAFAESRVDAMIGRHRDEIAAQPDPSARARSLADALTSEGYAASTRDVGAGEQLCQHHCPVAHVAAEFPQLCEAETAAFAGLLGTHVQRLATIARGDAACTTHVPTGSLPNANRSTAAPTEAHGHSEQHDPERNTEYGGEPA